MKRFYSIATLTVLFLPFITFAEDYIPMARLPIIDYGNLSIEAYLNGLYLLSISVAAILAVLKITLAGVKYVLSDIVTQKGDAKKDIQGALFGLLIVMAAFIILNTINEDLTVFAILSGVSTVVDQSDVTPQVAEQRALNAAQAAQAEGIIATAELLQNEYIDKYNECKAIDELVTVRNVPIAGTNQYATYLGCTVDREPTTGDVVIDEITGSNQDTIDGANANLDEAAAARPDPIDVDEPQTGGGSTGGAVDENEEPVTDASGTVCESGQTELDPDGDYRCVP